jgi:hypothetical protein
VGRFQRCNAPATAFDRETTGPEVEMVRTMTSAGDRIECSQCRALIECRRVRRIGGVAVATCTVCGGLEAVPQLRIGI